MTTPSLLDVEDLRTWFFAGDRIAPAVDGVSFRVAAGETLCIVGESGSGKSVTALSLMGLVPSPPGRVVSGRVRLEGRELRTLSERELRRVRGRDIAMIFQDPMSSLNPVLRVGDQVAEALELHLGLYGPPARERVVALFRQVGIPAPEERVDAFPHQLSGGMKQRVMIAMALACEPKLLIADEPTTALDVTIQAQILDLLRALQAQRQMGMILITHDLGVVAEIADTVAVMYAGTIVEHASVYDLFDHPKHPYTKGLFASLPSASMERGSRLQTIDGMVPSAFEFPTGCRFRTRCPYARPRCAHEVPTLREHGDAHTVACHFTEAIAEGVHEKTGPLIDAQVVRPRLDLAGNPAPPPSASPEGDRS